MQAEIINIGWEEIVVLFKTILLIFKELWYIWFFLAVILLAKKNFKKPKNK